MLTPIVGNYISEKTFIHKLDPRVKIISLLMLVFVTFINSGFVGYLILLSIVLILFKIAKIPIKAILRVVYFLRFMILFLLIMNSFIIKEGVLWFSIPGINWPFYDQLFIKTFYIFFRIVLMIAFSILLTATTKPLMLALGIEKLIKPLKIFKINVQVFAMMIAISLRFIPTLLLEAQNILNAQASRGLDFKNGSIKTKIKATFALIIPLLISSFNKADDLALSMEAKNYNPQIEVLRYRQLSFFWYDYFSFLLVILLFVLFLFYGQWLRALWDILKV